MKLSDKTTQFSRKNDYFM